MGKKIQKNPSNLLVRVISGAGFVAIVAGFFLLQYYVHSNLFAILLELVIIGGSFEVARAMNRYSNKLIFITQVVASSLFIPFYYLMYLLAKDVKVSVLCTFTFILFSMIVIINENIFTSKKGSPIKEVFSNLFPLLYPALLIFAMFLQIALWQGRSFIPLLLAFAVAPLCDTFAYFVGMTWQKIRKGNAKKLCPNLSPKKTIAGAIGGLVGGTVAGMIVYLIFMNTFSTKVFLIYSLIGLIASVFTEMGDLFESLVKRKMGIKDMGNIIPGHGGIMDRFDGISFAGAVIAFIFFIITLI